MVYRLFMMMILTLAMGISAATITRPLPVQAVGPLTIKASHQTQGSSINWMVTHYAINDSLNTLKIYSDTVRSTGDSVKITMIQDSGTSSFYTIRATENGVTDSCVIQVFTKGVVGKYIWKNPVIPSKPIPVFIHFPTGWNSSSKLLVAMHGVDRNGIDYAHTWRKFANANNYLIVAPQFSNVDWPTDAYTLGNMFTGNNGKGTLNPKELWSFSMVQQIQRDIVKVFGLNDSTYVLWGHSAGGQLVHRMAIFCPDSRISRYIAGNPGWYTMPDSTIDFPWGVRHPLIKTNLANSTSTPLTIMRGTADTIRDSNLSVDPRSDAQGVNRYARAGSFFKRGNSVNPTCLWKMVDVSGVGHEYWKMATEAGRYLLAETPILPDLMRSNLSAVLLTVVPPFERNSTTIKLTLPVARVIDVSLFTLKGTLRKTVHCGFLSAGIHTITLTHPDLSAGIYLCRVSSGTTSLATVKCIKQSE